jgi:hypothetical protein
MEFDIRKKDDVDKEYWVIQTQECEACAAPEE